MLVYIEKKIIWHHYELFICYDLRQGPILPVFLFVFLPWLQWYGNRLKTGLQFQSEGYNKEQRTVQKQHWKLNFAMTFLFMVTVINECHGKFRLSVMYLNSSFFQGRIIVQLQLTIEKNLFGAQILIYFGFSELRTRSKWYMQRPHIWLNVP